MQGVEDETGGGESAVRGSVESEGEDGTRGHVEVRVVTFSRSPLADQQWH